LGSKVSSIPPYSSFSFRFLFFFSFLSLFSSLVRFFFFLTRAVSISFSDLSWSWLEVIEDGLLKTFYFISMSWITEFSSLGLNAEIS